jgi:hypothetical protein
MRIQVRSAPTTMSVEVGKRMVGVIFTDACAHTLAGSYFVPMDNVLKRMPRFESCVEYSPFMEGIYLPKDTCVIV